MLKLSDLALRPDLQLGPMLVSPSRRLVEGPGGSAHLEPLIMQVFLLLLDAGGKVVTRNELFDQCWGGVMVGDDSLNRAIAKVRRTGGHVAPGLFEIETIPRTGYRLTGNVLSSQSNEVAGAQGRDTRQLVSRRMLIGGGAAAAAGIAGGEIWWSHTRADSKFQDLMKRGNDALNSSDPDDNPSQYFRQAVAMRPDNAEALGLFAYSQALRGDTDRTADGQTWLQEAARAADAALEIDPRQPDARLAQIVLESGTLDLGSTEDRLRQVLAADPTNIQAMRMLWNMLHCAGRSRDALALVERSLAIEPLASGSHYPRAQLLWITGRVAEADNVIAKAMQFWPTHRFVRFARFTIYAFTGRPGAALAMIEKPETAPQNFSPESIALWRETLPALDQRTSASIATARQAILKATKSNLRMTAQAAMVMSELGDVDTAFDLTNAYFGVGEATRSRIAAGTPPKSTAWRFTPWMFTPPIAAMRSDPRFEILADQIGLSAYWRARKIRPDYQIPS
jgi:DNA-binding winged helix-turn-helix (wHTH) protein/tetratricopeptide (TPR) repeat protein